MVHCFYNIELHSFVIKIAIDVIRCQLIASVVQTLGLKDTRVELDPIKLSDLNKNNFFYISYHTSFHNILHQFQVVSKLFLDHVSQFYIVVFSTDDL